MFDSCENCSKSLKGNKAIHSGGAVFFCSESCKDKYWTKRGKSSGMHFEDLRDADLAQRLKNANNHRF